MSPAIRQRMVRRCYRRMIEAESYDCRLHWWYRVQHYANRRDAVHR